MYDYNEEKCGESKFIVDAIKEAGFDKFFEQVKPYTTDELDAHLLFKCVTTPQVLTKGMAPTVCYLRYSLSNCELPLVKTHFQEVIIAIYKCLPEDMQNFAHVEIHKAMHS